MNNILLSLLVLLLTSPVPLRAAKGTAAGNVLLISPSGRALAMSEAVSAFPGGVQGVSGLHYNPAATHGLGSMEVSIMGQAGMADDHFGSLLFGVPTARGTFAGNFFYYTAGDVDLIDTLGRKRTVAAEKDYGVGLNYSESFFEGIATGISLKFFKSQLIESFSDTSIALDIGAQTGLFAKKLALGISAANIGSDLTYIEASEPLPLTFRLGGAYSLFNNPNAKAFLSGDVAKEKDEDLKEFIGFEYVWNGTVALRAGYKSGQDLGRFSGGAGFMLGKTDVHYALTDGGKAGRSHAVSVGYKFGDRPAETRRSLYR